MEIDRGQLLHHVIGSIFCHGYDAISEIETFNGIMGIKGLMSYVMSNSQFFENLKLRHTRIIIDGSNLYHRLYFDLHLDQHHAGDYVAFTAVVHTFFNALSACSIQPYVVLDGGCDPSDKKLNTMKQRAVERIRKAYNLSKGLSGTILPMLIREVFKQVLDTLKVPFIQCFCEADQEIFALANHWNCPVLTYDSDFCIFDLNAGYCPMDEFQWRNLGIVKDTRESYIPAKCFFVERLCNYFNHMNKALLPLFAVLTGNDYIDTSAFQAFFKKAAIYNEAGRWNSKKHGNIQGLLKWLSGFRNPDEALESVVNCLKPDVQNSVRELLINSMQEYQPANVKLEDFFQNGCYVCDVGTKSNLPEWFLEAKAKGRLSPFLSDVVALSRTFLFVQVENMQRPSAHKVSETIRRAIYGLLLNSCSEGQVSRTNKRGSMFCVNEFDRTAYTLKTTAIEVAITPTGTCQANFYVDKLTKAASSEHLTVLLEVLEAKTTMSDTLPLGWRLPVLVTCYWVQHCEPKVKLHHLQALLMGMVYGELHRIMSSPDADKLHGEKARMVMDYFLKLKNKKAETKQLDLDTAHIFCQWQSCLQMGFYLNQLLRFPLPEPDLTRIYTGSLVHQLCHEFKSSPSTKDLLNKCPSMEEFYQKLLCAVTSAIPLDFFQNKSSSKSRKNKKKK